MWFFILYMFLLTMKFKEKYHKIITALIKNSFPELRSRKILIAEFPGFISFAESTTIRLYSFHILFINKNCRNRKTQALKGQLAHELCHMAIDYNNKGLFASIVHFIRKTLSATLNTKFSRKIETRIDKETIKRGYRKERLALAFEREKTYSKEFLVKLYYSRGYLSPKQLK